MRDVPTSTEQTSTPVAAGSAEPTPETQTRALPQADETSRRRRALHQELAVRAGIALLMLVFNELLTMVATAQDVIRVAALLGLLVNVPYYLAARSGRWRRLQAWVRMAMDVGLITAGLYAAGGLAAAQYLGVYAIVPVYTGIVFSSFACLVITLLASVAYLALAGAQWFGLLPFTSPPHPDAWEVAIFNLLVLNIVGGLAAMLADAYRRSRHRLAAAYGELERAHEQSLRMHAQLGFQQVAHFREVGHKFGRWLDLVFVQRFLDAPGALDPLTKELIYVAISITNNCEYCMASHGFAARQRGANDAMLNEAFAVAGLANMTNRLANAYRVPVDEAFK